MILVLTYHKVLRAADGASGFYSIRAEQLERQLEWLAGSGLRARTPEELVGMGEPSPRGYLLSFDDGTADHYEVVLPLLARYGRRAVFFVPTAKLDCAGYLSAEQVREMSRVGHAIGLHGHEHRRLDRLGAGEVREQMETSRRIIGGLTGKPPVFFAPVGGYMSRRVREAALGAGVRVIRTMRWGYNRKLDLAALECVPVNRYLTEDEFRQVLEFRRRSAVLYAAKEIAKKALPSWAYESLRSLMFRARAEK